MTLLRQFSELVVVVTSMILIVGCNQATLVEKGSMDPKDTIKVRENHRGKNNKFKINRRMKIFEDLVKAKNKARINAENEFPIECVESKKANNHMQQHSSYEAELERKYIKDVWRY